MASSGKSLVFSEVPIADSWSKDDFFGRESFHPKLRCLDKKGKNDSDSDIY